MTKLDSEKEGSFVSEAATELPPTPCYVHGASQTPHLDAHLRQPSTQALLQKLSTAIGEIGNENCCSKCATESAARTMTVYLAELRAAKKNGSWTDEEKKGLKTEAKGLFKEVKKDVKKVWKANKRSKRVDEGDNL